MNNYKHLSHPLPRKPYINPALFLVGPKPSHEKPTSETLLWKG